MYITNFANLALTFFEKQNQSFPPLEEREGGFNPLKYTDPSGELYYLKQASSSTPDYQASRDYSNNIGRGNYGDITGGGGGAGYSYSRGTGYYYDSAGNIASFDEVYNNQILPNGITIYGGIDPTSIRFGKSHGVSGVWYQTTSVSSQTRIGDVGSSNFNATFNIGVVSTFTSTGQGGNVQYAGIEGGEHFIGPTLILLGQPLKALKPVGALGSKPGSSIASYTLSKTFPQTFTKVLGKQTGTKIATSLGTNVIGRAAGRFVPYVGWAWTSWDVGWYLGKNYGPSKWFTPEPPKSILLEYMRENGMLDE